MTNEFKFIIAARFTRKIKSQVNVYKFKWDYKTLS